MKFYLDTSVMVSALLQESETSRMQRWLASAQSEGLAISDWVMTEFSSALALKLRLKTMQDADRVQALGGMISLSNSILRTLSVSREAFRDATRICDRHELALRSGDALHLAIAAENALTLCTLDRRMAQAGPSLGIATQLL